MKPPSKLKLWLCTPHFFPSPKQWGGYGLVWFFTCTALVVEFHTRKNCYEFAAKIERFKKEEAVILDFGDDDYTDKERNRPAEAMEHKAQAKAAAEIEHGINNRTSED